MLLYVNTYKRVISNYRMICAPASSSSMRALSPRFLSTGEHNSAITETAKPSLSASLDVASTQWSVAMPTTWTSVTAASRSHCANNVDPSHAACPSTPEDAALYSPWRKYSRRLVTFTPGRMRAPSESATQCAGQVSTKSGSSEKWVPGSICQSCVATITP